MIPQIGRIMKIYVVDNGGQWTHREWRVLRYLDVDVKIIPNTTPFDEIKDEVARVKEAVADQEPQKVVVVEFMKDSIWNYDKTMLVGDMVAQMGGELMDLPSDIGAEDLLNANPDVLFIIGDDEKVANFMADEAYASLSAVQNNRVFPLDLSDVYTSGIRTIRGLNAIGKGLYPDLYTE